MGLLEENVPDRYTCYICRDPPGKGEKIYLFIFLKADLGLYFPVSTRDCADVRAQLSAQNLH